MPDYSFDNNDISDTASYNEGSVISANSNNVSEVSVGKHGEFYPDTPITEFPSEETPPSKLERLKKNAVLKPIEPSLVEKIARQKLDAIFSLSPEIKFESPIANNESGGLSQQGDNMLSPQSAYYLAVHPEEWRTLFADADGRRHFLQVLDERRSRSALLHPKGFQALTTAMQVITTSSIFWCGLLILILGIFR